jgi:hypothetical protein
MRTKAANLNVYAKVSPTRAAPAGFFYEIWRDYRDGNRWEIEVSHTYTTSEAAETACDKALPLYMRKRGLLLNELVRMPLHFHRHSHRPFGAQHSNHLHDALAPHMQQAIPRPVHSAIRQHAVERVQTLAPQDLGDDFPNMRRPRRDP